MNAFNAYLQLSDMIDLYISLQLFFEKWISSAFSSLPISAGSSSSTFSQSVSLISPLLLFRSVASSLSAGGLTHRGGGHKTSQAEPTEREMEGKRERESWGL